MNFKTLKDKCEYYRGLTDYRLMPNSNLLIMVDGHSFSKKVKEYFERPFDGVFIDAMNRTAKYLCESIQGAKIAYITSDEISILVTDYDTPMTDSFFGYRLCKIQSLVAGMASAYFNRAMVERELIEAGSLDSARESVESLPYYDFDCKAWTVPNDNDAYAWFLYRQIDGIRNSKQQAAQTYMEHKELLNLSADEQIAKLEREKNIDWYTEYNDGEKYGRFVYKMLMEDEREDDKGNLIKFSKNRWGCIDAVPLMDMDKDSFFDLFRKDYGKQRN